jgi:polysaccharide transporter, PST family
MTANLVPPLRPPSWRTDSLASSVLVLIVMTILQRVIGFGRGILFCRWLGPAELGQWDLAWGFIDLAVPLMMLGLPGSFGRRTTVATGACAAVAIVLLALASQPLAHVLFGTREQAPLVLLIAAGLAAVAVYYYLITLLTALRRSRIVARLEFTNGLLFAGLATLLLVTWRVEASSVIVAYALASLLTGTIAGLTVRSIWQGIPADDTPLEQRALWSKLLPFALWVWGTNWIANLFELADRYMLIHFGRFTPHQALVEVGNYHSARVVPLLLVSITGMLATILTPYLSHDWETRGREVVARRMNLAVKLLALGLMAGAVGIHFAAPLLFSLAFQGKYAGGQAILSWTLVYCIWLGLGRLAQKYLWCAERVHWAVFAWCAGLLTNVGLNFLLLPRWGLCGVVWSTAAGNAVALGLIYAANFIHGMRVDAGTWLMSVAPLSLVAGRWMSPALLVGIAVAAVYGHGLFGRAEKAEMARIFDDYLARFRQVLTKRKHTLMAEGSP